MKTLNLILLISIVVLLILLFILQSSSTASKSGFVNVGQLGIESRGPSFQVRQELPGMAQRLSQIARNERRDNEVAMESSDLARSQIKSQEGVRRLAAAAASLPTAGALTLIR